MTADSDSASEGSTPSETFLFALLSYGLEIRLCQAQLLSSVRITNWISSFVPCAFPPQLTYVLNLFEKEGVSGQK